MTLVPIQENWLCVLYAQWTSHRGCVAWRPCSIPAVRIPSIRPLGSKPAECAAKFISRANGFVHHGGGKSNWVTLREDVVEAKGRCFRRTGCVTRLLQKPSQSPAAKPMMQKSKTTWCTPTAAALKTADNCAQVQDKIQRLVQWNNELLLQLLKQVVTRRHALHGRRRRHRRRLILWHLTLEWIHGG
jgi:hypothetical protein